MFNDPKDRWKPTYGLWKRFLWLIPLVLALAIASVMYIRSVSDTFTAQRFVTYGEETFASRVITFTNPGIVEVTSLEYGVRDEWGEVLVGLRALADGETQMTFGPPEPAYADALETWSIEVRNGAIIQGGINFSGWQAIRASLMVFFAALVLTFAICFMKLWRVSWYGYTMVICMGGIIFFSFQLFLFAFMMATEYYPSFYHFLLDVQSMVQWFVISSVMPMVPLCILVSLSNIALIRHEGMRLVNLLGIAASVVWAVVIVWWILSDSVVFLARDAWVLTRALIPLGIAYGECLLFSIILCAGLAAQDEPDQGMDYLVILGCGLRDDGTPCPLLAGRVDRAASFDEERQKMGDAPAVFVPSGGQGADEIMSEAQSMGNYLMEQWGMEPERIALEDRSVRTSENMRFSREVIERHARRDVSELSVGFSTTNYHVFRGYVCAHQAGMAVKGLGSKTKFYFWPNAFLREFVGLLVAKWKTLLQVYAVIAVIYIAAMQLLRMV